MATRDLHDQKILRALEGIERQLAFQNFILKSPNEQPYPVGVIKGSFGGFTKVILPVFTNSDGTKTPLVPAENINYYVHYVDRTGRDSFIVMDGKKLMTEENAFFLQMAKEILFCYEEGKDK